MLLQTLRIVNLRPLKEKRSIQNIQNTHVSQLSKLHVYIYIYIYIYIYVSGMKRAHGFKMRPMIKKQTENVTIYKQSIPPKLPFYALNIFTF